MIYGSINYYSSYVELPNGMRLVTQGWRLFEYEDVRLKNKDGQTIYSNITRIIWKDNYVLGFNEGYSDAYNALFIYKVDAGEIAKNNCSSKKRFRALVEESGFGNREFGYSEYKSFRDLMQDSRYYRRWYNRFFN